MTMHVLRGSLRLLILVTKEWASKTEGSQAEKENQLPCPWKGGDD